MKNLLKHFAIIIFAPILIFATDLNSQIRKTIEQYLQLGDAKSNDSEAIALFENALALNPRDGSIHIRIADRQKSMGHINLALSSFRNAIRLGGDTTHAMFQQAEILKSMSLSGEFNVNLAVEAVRRYRDVYLRDNSCMLALRNRGVLLYHLAQNSSSDVQASRRLANEALLMFRKYLDFNLEDVEASGFLERVYTLLGELR